MIKWPLKGADVHFDIVCEGPPPDFTSGPCELTFTNVQGVRKGPGSVTSTTTSLYGEITYDDPLKPGSMRSYGGGNPGRLVPESEFATVTRADEATPTWRGEGAYIVNQQLDDPLRPYVRFTLNSLTIEYAKGDAAFTREIHRGPQLKYARMFSPYGSTGARSDRIEGRALGRRTTIRNLGSGEVPIDLLAIVYDGPPHTEHAADALWLGVSTLAGQDLQPIAVETYDAQGAILSRRFCLGVNAGDDIDQPFHIHYAPFNQAWLERIIDGIHTQLINNFPIDIVIAHIHDGAGGSIERRMQSYLLGLHAASEAWNRLHGETTIAPKDSWARWARPIGAVAGWLAGRMHPDLAPAVRAKINDANNVGMNSRMRAFCGAMELALAGLDRKAVDLRNPLFHDGYLQRRFINLDHDKRQERFDQVQRLRDFTRRAMFSLIGFDGTFQGALHQLRAIPVRNRLTELTGQARRP